MKLKCLFVPLFLISLCLVGCTRDNANNDNVAYRTNNDNQPARVNYDTRAGRPGVTDTNQTDPRLTNVRNNVDNNDNLVDVRDNDNDLNNDNGRPRMRVADQAADRIANLADVDTANVIATDNNAYVAVKLANGAKLTNKLKNKISNAVKKTDNDIDNVYVSANPDFFQHMSDYGKDIRSGRPVTGFFNEFSQMIQRTFPNQK